MKTVEVTGNLTVNILLEDAVHQLNEVNIQTEKDRNSGITRLKGVDGTNINEGKKSEVVLLNDLTANLSTNNTRQIHAKVAGLNIWENDGAGIQLGIGGRGLNPSRVTNFNTLQNG